MDKDELDEVYDFGNVPLNIELKAAFLGKEDELIIEYIKKFPNKIGPSMANLLLYFCYKYGFIGERRLKNRLKHMIKCKYITTYKTLGLTFYQKI